ncbi:MAG: hypothetical protein IJ303_05470, partial [Clostridia bacterium]|nr:hypothetical protein [Clostridia bacterium]
MKTAEDYPKKWGVIIGFFYAPTDYLQIIKTDLFISLPISAISHIQNHYRIYEHRDPLVEEMIMLDILFSNAKYEAEQSKKLFLSDLKTDDEEIKAALKDLNEKLCALDPGRSGPLPFEDVLTTPGRYIRSIMPGRCPGSLRLRFWNKENDLRPPDFSHKTQSFSIDKSQICFDITTFEEKMYIEKGDYIQIENSESLRDILSHLKEDGVSFKSSVIRKNIIEEILSHGRHCDIHVPYSLPHAACMGRGDILLLCKERHSQKICSALAENGISFKLAGRKKTKGNLTFFGNINKLTLRSSMIYDLTRPCQNRLVSAVIKSNMLKAQPSCCFEELTPYKKLTEYTLFFKDKKELFVSSVKSTLT